METVHAFGSVPRQPPLHPANTDVGDGTATRETVLPPKIVAEQVVPQSMLPLNSEVDWMVPDPFPALATVRVNTGTTVTICMAELFASARSDSLPDTFIAFAIVPVVVGVTTTVTWVSAASAREPMLQVTEP